VYCGQEITDSIEDERKKERWKEEEKKDGV